MRTAQVQRIGRLEVAGMCQHVVNLNWQPGYAHPVGWLQVAQRPLTSGGSADCVHRPAFPPASECAVLKVRLSAVAGVAGIPPPVVPLVIRPRPYHTQAVAQHPTYHRCFSACEALVGETHPVASDPHLNESLTARSQVDVPSEGPPAGVCNTPMALVQSWQNGMGGGGVGAQPHLHSLECMRGQWQSAMLHACEVAVVVVVGIHAQGVLRWHGPIFRHTACPTPRNV